MLSRLFSRFRRALPPRPAQAARRPGLLRLEPLEAREVPAVVYALGVGANANTLYRFDSAAPANTTPIAVTGLGASTLVGIDFRPRTGQLIGVGVNGNVVTTFRIDAPTGAASVIGSVDISVAAPGNTIAGATAFGVDFNPTVDRIRVVNNLASDGVGGNANNFRLNPNTGALVAVDPDLDFTGLPGGNANAPEVAVAYSNTFDNPGGVTTLRGIVSGGDRLVINGGAAPGFPTLTNVGLLGFDTSNNAAFDIAVSTDNGGQGTALAILEVAGVSQLFTINLGTGAATLIGNVGNGTVDFGGMAIVPDGSIVVGSGLGANGDVRILDPDSGAVRLGLVPFGGFQGGVRVAAGDVNRDGIPDVVVSAIFPQGHVKVFDGVTGAQLPGFIGSFFAFAGFQGTVNVATGDVNGDGFTDVLVVANGASGHVKAFSGADGTLLASFFAYQGFLGNVTISAADFDNDGDDEIVTAAAVNGHVRVFNANGTPFLPPVLLPGFVNSFFAFQGFLGNVNVAAGDVNGDGVADIVAVSGPPTAGNIRVFNGPDGALFSSFFPVSVTFGTSPPVQIGTIAGLGLADVNSDGRYEIVVTPSAGLQANVTAYTGSGSQVGASVPAFANFLGGATVGGIRF